MNIALILSGGTGTRVGTEVPKQYIEAGGKPVIAYGLETLAEHEGIHRIQIVADQTWREIITDCIPDPVLRSKLYGFSKPGENRQLSIFHGLEDIRRYAADTDCVLIHDAARPLLSAALVTACLEAVSGHDGVVPVLPVKDTVYSSTDGRRITGLLNRSEIFAGQAPEVFRLGKYYLANLELFPDKILQINGAAEPAAMLGLDIILIPGDEENFKITTKADLVRFRKIVEERE